MNFYGKNIAEKTKGKTSADKKETAPSFARFAKATFKGLNLTTFHRSYYRLLEEFARGRIGKLMISVPPQHGKSLGSSVLLPAYLLGLDPDLKITIASYNADLASRFNRRVQRLIDSPQYARIFPLTRIRALNARSDSVRTASRVEMEGRGGELVSVGREGSLTGNEVDVIILDDLYKDAMEANSPLIRENCWQWYISVVKTRLHNSSREVIVFTRWHEEDLIGEILKKEEHVIVDDLTQIGNVPPDTWCVLNLEAIKDSPPTVIDPREKGEPLWPEKQSAGLLAKKRALDPVRFECMYQGRPSPSEGLLYGDNFSTYQSLPADCVKKGNYTDTADTGEDYLCSVCYEVTAQGIIYVTDVVYSAERMEVTEKLVADMLKDNMTRVACFESNNGGKGFARAVGGKVPFARIEWFHQSANKEARILSNSATVISHLRMPEGWSERWPDFYHHLVTYRRLFRANRWHDAPDVLTGIVELEVVEQHLRRIRKIGYASAV